MASNATQTEEKLIEQKLALIQLGRFATWIFIMGSFFYLYSFDEEEKALLSTTKEKATTHQQIASNSVAEGSILFLVAIILLTIMTWEKLQLLMKDADSSSELIDGEALVFKANLIKIVGFFGATTGYMEIADAMNQSSD